MIVLKKCRHGNFLFNPEDTFIGGSLAAYGEFSECEVWSLAQVLPEGGTLVDIGANIGCLTVPLARKAGKVIAVEPQRVTFQHLCANVALNKLRNVHTVHAAVGANEGSMLMEQVDWDVPGNFGGQPVQQADDGELVRIVTVDGFNLDSCDLLKIDVEGMEGEVLAGSLATIRKFHPVIYVEAEKDDRTPALIDQLVSLGYKPWWHCPPLFNPNNHDMRAENAFPDIVSINLLCLPVGTEPPQALDLYPCEPGDNFTRLKQRVT